MDNPNRLISLVNTRGRVTWVHMWEVENLRNQGYKVINNAKEEYYPQYDLTLSTTISPDIDLPGQIDIENVLEAEDV